MKHLRRFNENIEDSNSDNSFNIDGKTFYKAIDYDDFEPNRKEEELKNKISDMITNWVEMKSVPYGDHCNDCGRGDEQFDDVTVDKAASEIIELLKKEGLL